MAFLEIHTRLLITAVITLLVFISAIVSQSPCENVNLLATKEFSYISSSTYSSNNVSMRDCQWHITTGSDASLVLLEFTSFSLKGLYYCYTFSEYLAVYDGPSTNSQLMKYLCGTKYMDGQFQFESTSSDMTIVFHSNESTSGSFQFKYKSEQKAKNTVVNCTNINLKATSTAAYFTSPNYPNRYPSSMDCQWHITVSSDSSVVVIEIQECALEPRYSTDYVKVYDGPTADAPEIKIWCGSFYPYILKKTVINSTNQVITVVFHSDQYNNYDGFSFKYFSKEKPVPCTSVNLLATRSSNSIRSPSYSSAGERSMDCLWVIRTDSNSSVVLVEFGYIFMFNSISCTDSEEYVAVFDGPTTNYTSISLMCVSSVLTQRFNSTTSYMTIQYYSRWKAAGRFTFTYRSSEKTSNITGRPNTIENTSNTTGRPNTVNCTNINLEASSSAAYLTSPNYPNKYPSSMDCQWHITANMNSSVVVIEIQQCTLEDSMLFEPPRDYVRLYDGPTVNSPLIKTLEGSCYTRERFDSTNQVMTILFYSDQYNNYDGFSFKYFTKEKPVPCTSVNLLATTNSRDIYSPSYSPDGRSMDCLWTIRTDSDSSVVLVEFNDFLMFNSMGCTEKEEYVALYDGPTTTSKRIASPCGSWTRVNSTNSYMTIQYYSRWKSPGSFKFTYWSLEPPNNIVVRPTFDVFLEAQETANYLTSPNYPDNYSSLVHYQWRIHAGKYDRMVELELMNFTLEGSQPTCEHDYVEIYDGTIGPGVTSKPIKLLCGEVFYARFISSFSYMTVVFRSDEQNNYSGFRFKYLSKGENGYSSVDYIIGSIVSGTVVIIIIVFVVCAQRRMNRTWRRIALRGISNQDVLSPEVITQSPVFIVSQVTFDPSIPPPTYMEVQNSQSTTDPPSYSSICAHLNENMSSTTSRNSDNSDLDLPPSYSSAVNITVASQKKPATQPNHSRPERSPGSDQNATRMPTSSATGTDLSTGITPVMFRPSYFSAARHPRNAGMNTNIGAPPVYASVPHNQHGGRHQSRQSHSSTYDL